MTGVSGNSYTIPAGSFGTSPAQFAAIDPAGIGPDPAAVKYWSQYPLPNDPGRDGRNIMGFRFAAPLVDKFNVGVARLDYKIDPTGNHTLFWRGTYQHDRLNSAPQFPGRPPNVQTALQPKGFSVGYNAVLNPRVVNSFHWGWTHFSQLDAGLQNSNVSTFRFLDTLRGRSVRLRGPVRHGSSPLKTLWTI